MSRRKSPGCKCKAIILTRAITCFASAVRPCCGDSFGPEAPIQLPPIDADELRFVEPQLKDGLPQMTASCVRIESSGSGVIISPDGLVLTHSHQNRDRR